MIQDSINCVMTFPIRPFFNISPELIQILLQSGSSSCGAEAGVVGFTALTIGGFAGAFGKVPVEESVNWLRSRNEKREVTIQWYDDVRRAADEIREELWGEVETIDANELSEELRSAIQSMDELEGDTDKPAKVDEKVIDGVIRIIEMYNLSQENSSTEEYEKACFGEIFSSSRIISEQIRIEELNQ